MMAGLCSQTEKQKAESESSASAFSYINSVLLFLLIGKRKCQEPAGLL